jgi:hypothetical protein
MLEDLPVPTAPILFGKYYVVDFAKQHSATPARSLRVEKKNPS